MPGDLESSANKCLYIFMYDDSVQMEWLVFVHKTQ